MVTAGVGAPEAASWPGVYSTRVSPPSLVTHRSPPASKARPEGASRLPLLAEMVTAGVGAAVAPSWPGVYSTMVFAFPLPLATHRSPWASKASPVG